MCMKIAHGPASHDGIHLPTWPAECKTCLSATSPHSNNTMSTSMSSNMGTYKNHRARRVFVEDFEELPFRKPEGKKPKRTSDKNKTRRSPTARRSMSRSMPPKPDASDEGREERLKRSTPCNFDRSEESFEEKLRRKVEEKKMKKKMKRNEKKQARSPLANSFTATTRRQPTARPRENMSMPPNTIVNIEDFEEKLRRKVEEKMKRNEKKQARSLLANSCTAIHPKKKQSTLLDKTRRAYSNGACLDTSRDKFEKQMLRLHLGDRLRPTVKKTAVSVNEGATRRLLNKSRSRKITPLAHSCCLSGSWRCPNCSYVNPPAGVDNPACRVCKKPHAQRSSQGGGSPSTAPSGVRREGTRRALEDDAFYNVPARVFTRNPRRDETQKRAMYSRVLIVSEEVNPEQSRDDDEWFYNVPARVFTENPRCNETRKRAIYSRVLI